MNYIINADDFGRDHTKNTATDIGLREGLIHRASLMMNAEGTEEAVSMARTGGYMDRICFHLNLTDGYPMTEAVKGTPLCGDDGRFRKNSNTSIQKKCFNRKTIAAIREECEAQIRLFREKGFTSTHLDSHRWIMYNFPVWRAIRPLLPQYGFRDVRTMKGHLLSGSGTKLRPYYKLLQKAIGLSGIAWSEDWAGCSDEFLKQIQPEAEP
jgi:predicted glycoside hydrolase/deacetylase ChbG (UPF0249 family)